MSKPNVPAWLPDWKNASAYQKTHIEYTWPPEPSLAQPWVPAEEIIILPIEEWPWQVWVWEFLRRNTEYQADYERFVSLPDFHPRGGKTPKWSARSMRAEDDMKFRYCDPPALPDETSKQYWTRLDGQVLDEMPLENHLMEKWCITTPTDPAKDDGYRIFGPEIEMPPYHLQIEKYMGGNGRYISIMPPPDEPEHVTLRFDLRYGIDAQLKRAKETLLYRRDHLKNSAVPYTLDKIQSKDHLYKLPAYLRAYDASLAGTTFSEIGETLFPTDVDDRSRRGKAERAVESGREYVNGGYKDLIIFRLDGYKSED